MKIKASRLKVLIQESITRLIQEAKHNLVAYHGTNDLNATQITSKGFDVGLDGSKLGVPGGGISFSRDKSIAKEHAKIAVQKFGGKPAIIKVNLSDLTIMSGSEFNELFTKVGSYEAAIQVAKRTYDGADLCDLESGDGCEELEVVVWNTSKLIPKGNP